MTLEREWVTIVDPADDHLRYTFDVSFLLSSYRCIYGDGCPGVHPDGGDPVTACCIHGAYLTEDDEGPWLERIVEDDLDADTMQFHGLARDRGLFEQDEEGETRTRVVDGACIFANRAGFPAGEGCALHHLAARRGDHHMTYKPVVCWQVPLHRRVDEVTGNDGATVEVHTIAAFERGTWGEGGADFSWWCTEAPEAFTADRALYRTMREELRRMVGDAVYEELAAYLDRRSRSRHRVRFLPLV